MPIRTLATLAVAIFLGLGAVVLAQLWLGRQRQADVANASVTGTVPVVVATQPIERGAAIQPTALKIVRFPQASAPAGAIANISDISTGGPRYALRPIVANEPILASKITVPGGKVNMSASLTPGMRAVTFRANDVAGVAGFVLPGDRVDVLLTRTAGGGDGSSGYLTQVVADNLKVLGVDQVDDETATKPVVAKAITLEVTPEQAQTISLAQAVGTVSLSLRQVSDQAMVGKRLTTISDLGGGFRAAAPRAPVLKGAARPATRVASVSGPKISVTRGVVSTEYAVAR